MAKRVTTIPATVDWHNASLLPQKRRVAAYARVSTDLEEQMTSYEAQVDYYTAYIKSREDWDFVAVYTDDGISGCSTKRREGFKRMVADALEGRIDLIITKSVSRFARNTVDSLTAIRQLKDKGVECYFEKENIWTFDGKGELLLTIMSSLAQEEARSISENVKWGHRKRFADGKVSLAYSRFLGYDKGEDGGLVVNEEQAKTVRLIYKLFLDGLTPHSIARELTRRQLLTPGGVTTWSASTVKSILTNEKYKGDALLQKSYIADFLTKKQVANQGEIPQYYVEDNHPAIIAPDVFDMVQQEMASRLSGKERYSGVDRFSSKIKCGECGSWFGAKVWHSNDKYRRVVYQCNHKHKFGCSTPHLIAQQIEQIFVAAVNRLLTDRDEVMENIRTVQSVLCDASALEQEEQEVRRELSVLEHMMADSIAENARCALNQDEYRQRYDRLADKYDGLQRQLAVVTQGITERKAKREQFQRFMQTLCEQKDLIAEFDAALWGSLLECIIVQKDGEVQVLFKDGTTI